MLKQKLAKAFECLTVIGGGLSPLLLSNLIHSFIERSSDMETIQNQGSVEAVIFDGSYIGLTHVPTGPLDLFFLVITELFGKEFINGVSALARELHSNAFRKKHDQFSVSIFFLELLIIVSATSLLPLLETHF